MTSRSGPDPQNQAVKRGTDGGWKDYWPEDAVDVSAAPQSVRRAGRQGRESRDYRTSRSGSPAAKLRFLAFGGLLIVLVLGGLYLFVRPAVVSAVGGWGADNPAFQGLPFVADLVREELGPSLTDPLDATDHRERSFDVQAGDSAYTIGRRLQEKGFIADGRAFVFESIQRDVTANFIIGRYTLSASMTVDEIIDAMTTPALPKPTVRLTFREGLRIEQMVAKMEYLEAHPADPEIVLRLDVKAYYDMAMHPPADLLADYSWLGLPPGASLEGFLFPATFDVNADISPRQLIELQLDAFHNNAPRELFTLKPAELYRVVQIASLVEPEAPLDTDRPLVAGVFVNRLDPKAWPTGLLNSNPTVNYAADSVWLRDHPIESWLDYAFWNPIKSDAPLSQVTFPDDIAPYNTYRHHGLPPTPICSPSKSALQAALAPDTEDGYFYFVAKNDGTGGLAFAKTLAEHNANLKKYGYLP